MAKTKKGKRHPSTELWSWHSVRLQMSILLMFAFLFLSLMRGNLGMALMCMVERDNQTLAFSADHNTALQVQWSKADISLMHMCFYAGIFLCTFVAQNYTQKFGPKAVISIGMIVNIICTWAVPLAAFWVPHFSSVAALRFGMGVSQGFFIPCASMLIAKWFPEAEKSIAMAIFTTGNQLGIAIAMYSTAELCKLPILGGWPSSFFLYGLLGLLFLLIWQPLATNKPRESKLISLEELAHIDGIGTRKRAATLIQKTPYRKLLLSPVVLAICLCSFAQAFVFVAMISYLPEFFRSTLDLDLSSNGIWSAMPFLVQMLSKIFVALLANSIRKSGKFSHQFITKFFNIFASLGCTICMLAVSLTSNPVLMLVFLCGAFAFLSGYVPGYNTSIVCVAPPFTAAISAYGQAFGQVASILAPIIIGLLTAKNPNQLQQAWSLVFQMLALFLLLTGIFFQFFGSVKVQPWAMFGPNVGGGDAEMVSRRIQRISEANEQLKAEEEEMYDKMELGEDLVVEEEKENNNKNKNEYLIGIPRMHHRLSVLDI